MRVIVDSMHTINMKLYKSVSYCKNIKIFIFHITNVETVKALVGLHKFKAAPEMPLWRMPLPLSHGLVNSDLDLQCLPVCPKV